MTQALAGGGAVQVVQAPTRRCKQGWHDMTGHNVMPTKHGPRCRACKKITDQACVTRKREAKQEKVVRWQPKPWICAVARGRYGKTLTAAKRAFDQWDREQVRVHPLRKPIQRGVAA